MMLLFMDIALLKEIRWCMEFDDQLAKESYARKLVTA
jgi:hypothetical protein